MASERGLGQTVGTCTCGVVGPRCGTGVASRRSLESSGIEGDTPVGESGNGPSGIPSTTGHVEPGGKLGGPSSKPKYLSATDSE